MERADSTEYGDYRGKSHFVGAAQPDLALREFFAELGEDADQPSPAYVSKPRARNLPLILISQLPRSGGSLLSQLCDGHKQLLVYPSEMRLGYPCKDDWPTLDPAESPERLFARLFQSQLARLAQDGYRKIGKAKIKHDRLAFGYSPSNHYRAFVERLDAAPWSNRYLERALAGLVRLRRTKRGVLNAYFDALFHAWPQGNASDARYVVGFVPRTALKVDSVADFFNDYPDGRLVSIMRHPADWFVSRRAHTKGGVPRYGELDQQARLWSKMAETAMSYRKIYSERFLLLSFRDLVTDREGTMRRLSKWCGIDFQPSLLHQTFGGSGIRPNTNFQDSPAQRPEAVLERHTQLCDSERDRINEITALQQVRLLDAGCPV